MAFIRTVWLFLLTTISLISMDQSVEQGALSSGKIASLNQTIVNNGTVPNNFNTININDGTGTNMNNNVTINVNNGTVTIMNSNVTVNVNMSRPSYVEALKSRFNLTKLRDRMNITAIKVFINRVMNKEFGRNNMTVHKIYNNSLTYLNNTYRNIRPIIDRMANRTLKKIFSLQNKTQILTTSESTPTQITQLTHSQTHIENQPPVPSVPISNHIHHHYHHIDKLKEPNEHDQSGQHHQNQHEQSIPLFNSDNGSIGK